MSSSSQHLGPSTSAAAAAVAVELREKAVKRELIAFLNLLGVAGSSLEVLPRADCVIVRRVS